MRRHLPVAVRPVIAFAFLTGWRIPSEVPTLQSHQVDLDARIVRLDAGTTKNREGRTVPFAGPPALRDLLEAQRALTDAVETTTGQIVPFARESPCGCFVARG